MRFVRLGELLGAEDPNKVFIERYRAEKNRLRLGKCGHARSRSIRRSLFLALRAIGGHRNPVTGGLLECSWGWETPAGPVSRVGYGCAAIDGWTTEPWTTATAKRQSVRP